MRLKQPHFGTCPRCTDRRCHTRRPSAANDDIGIRVERQVTGFLMIQARRRTLSLGLRNQRCPERTGEAGFQK